MSIYKINNNLPTTTKIELLNNMILELKGLMAQGKFDINEIDDLYDDLGSGHSRKYLRNQSLGHTFATYSGWSHIYGPPGYSIWRYSPTNYQYNALNQLYLDNKILENRGLALTESKATFSQVWQHENGTYTSMNTEAGTSGGTSFPVISTLNLLGSHEIFYSLYVGSAAKFGGMTFDFDIPGVGYDLEFYYYNGSAWVILDRSGYNFEDATENFESNGRVSWDIPSDWTACTRNSVSAYWIRVTSNTTPETIAKVYSLRPDTSVVDLLSLSSSEILAEEWAWCTYGSNIYVTLRNAGAAAYEGSYFISPTSSTKNKSNYFISNHEITADYADSTSF